MDTDQRIKSTPAMPIRRPRGIGGGMVGGPTKVSEAAMCGGDVRRERGEVSRSARILGRRGGNQRDEGGNRCGNWET